MPKIEEGVMVVRGGKAWGESDYDRTDGWCNLESGKIYDPRFVKVPTAVVFRAHHLFNDFREARVVRVKRTTTVELLP